MTVSKLHLASVVAAVVCSLPVACASKNSGGSGSESSQLAASGNDSADTEANLETVGQSFVGTDANGNLAAQSLATLNPKEGELSLQDNWSNPAGGFYHPAGCLTASADTATKTVTYAFNDCTGPLGLVHLTGAVTVVWSSSGPTNLQLVYSATNFKINQATVSNWNATAVITANGSAREMTWTASLTGTTGNGRAFDRTNNKDLKWIVGQPCLAISGSSDGTITGKHLVTTITNYQRCADSCPAAGSEINVKDVDDGASIDLKYLGGPKAQFTAVDGTVTDLPLFCGI